jgi:hypothetical protein
MISSFDEFGARRAELAVRATALLVATVAGPAFAFIAAATGRPLLCLGTVAASAPLAVVRLVRPPEDLDSRELPTTTPMAQHGSMNQIQRLLLLELEGLPSTPNRLRAALAGWQYDVTTDIVVDHLRALERDALVSGPGMSLLHDTPVWLTANGQQRLKSLGDDFGAWRRVA